MCLSNLLKRQNYERYTLYGKIRWPSHSVKLIKRNLEEKKCKDLHLFSKKQSSLVQDREGLVYLQHVQDRLGDISS